MFPKWAGGRRMDDVLLVVSFQGHIDESWKVGGACFWEGSKALKVHRKFLVIFIAQITVISACPRTLSCWPQTNHPWVAESSVLFVNKVQQMIGLVPRLPRSGMQTLKLCRRYIFAFQESLGTRLADDLCNINNHNSKIWSLPSSLKCTLTLVHEYCEFLCTNC